MTVAPLLLLAATRSRAAAERSAGGQRAPLRFASRLTRTVCAERGGNPNLGFADGAAYRKMARSGRKNLQTGS